MQIEDATFTISVDCDEYSENLGEAMWYIPYREVKRILKRLTGFAASNVTSDLEQYVLNCEEENEDDKSQLADALVEVAHDPDCAIALICAMIHLGGEWNLNYQGGDSEYWFYHDLHHAQNDFSILEDGTVSAYISEEAEQVATAESALVAREAGVSVGDIARQLVKVEQEWGNRFSGEVFFLEDFLD